MRDFGRGCKPSGATYGWKVGDLKASWNSESFSRVIKNQATILLQRLLGQRQDNSLNTDHLHDQPSQTNSSMQITRSIERLSE